jgi:prevent-host-death family protein
MRIDVRSVARCRCAASLKQVFATIPIHFRCALAAAIEVVIGQFIRRSTGHRMPESACVRIPTCPRTEYGLNAVIPIARFASMKYSTRIKSISYLKANAAEIVRELAEQHEPLVITQNGEAKAIIQDVASYEATQETLALLKILALGNRQIEEGKVVPAADVIGRLRAKNKRAG